MHLDADAEAEEEAQASMHPGVLRDAEDFPSRVTMYSSSIRRAGAGVPEEISIGDYEAQNANEEQSANDDVPENEDANVGVENVDEGAHEKNEAMSANVSVHDEEDQEVTEHPKDG